MVEGKGATRNKGKGKEKRSERPTKGQSDMYCNQAEEEQDGSRSSWDDCCRPASSKVDYGGPKDRPDFDSTTQSLFDELVQVST